MSTASIVTSIPKRVEALRGQLRERGLTHYLVPSADENVNEYLPPWRERRQWASGFTGSAGDLLIALEPRETLLFTDGRYHLQAERQLEGSGIALERVGAPGGKTLGQRLVEFGRAHGERCVVGFDPAVLPIATVEAFARLIAPTGAAWRAVTPNLVDLVWKDRPAPPETALLACPVEWTGAAPADKIQALRKALDEHAADGIAVVKLDQIAWLLNLRSLDDVPYNPVFEAMLYVDARTVHVFVRSPRSRLPQGFGADIGGFEAHRYEEFDAFLRTRRGARVAVDPDGVTQAVLEALTAAGATVVRTASSIEQAKAHKNDAELACMRRANLLASLAKHRALRWLAAEIDAGRTVTERGFLQHIERLYAALPGYRGLSFNTISATGEHGAIIHYGSADDTPLRRGEMFIIDSGIQFDGGTTDDTRTVIVGASSAEQRHAFTRVLQGHIAGARAVFPEGTSGAAIDALTRAPMWQDGLNYDHGTGHGVGAFLNVHEGPFALAETRRRANAVVSLEPGMITSIEPGYYRKGFGGIRLENLYVVKDTGRVVDGRRYFGFEPLTWVPFDDRLIEPNLLSDADRSWLADYAKECKVRLDAAERGL